jgi:hypothetical protein
MVLSIGHYSFLGDLSLSKEMKALKKHAGQLIKKGGRKMDYSSL